jgi:hypothetical protein
MECFAWSIDPFFEIATRAIAELQNQNRYEIQHTKTSWIDRVKSANNNNQHIYHNLNGLARRLGICARICMAHSAGMNPTLRQVVNCYDRNLEDLTNFHTDPPGAAQNLALNQAQEKKYCNEYDRLYPQHAIEDHIANAIKDHIANGNDAAAAVHSDMPTTMYIFRNNWNEVIQISTTMHIEDRGEAFEQENEDEIDNGRYNCRIQVVTIQAGIAEGQNQKFMRFLVALSNAHNPHNQAEDFVNQLQQLAINDDLADLLVDVEVVDEVDVEVDVV